MAFHFDAANGRPLFSWQVIGDNLNELVTDDGRVATKENLIPEALETLEYTTAANTSSFTFHSNGSCHYIIDWGDGSDHEVVQSVSADSNTTHTYATAGQYVIKVHVISGTLRPQHYTNSAPETTNLVGVEGTGGLFKYTLQSAWRGTLSLTSFCKKKMMDVSKVTNFTYTWRDCEALEEFPRLNFSKGEDFLRTWYKCKELTSFPSVDFSSATDFRKCWKDCEKLADFPPNQFDTTGDLRSDAFYGAFDECALTAQSIENILVSLDTNGASNIQLDLSGGTNAGKSTWSTAAVNAFNSLDAKGWTITNEQ